jgi:hypothetical protein
LVSKGFPILGSPYFLPFDTLLTHLFKKTVYTAKGMGGSAAQLAILCSDGTVVYDFIAGTSGSMKVGNTISVYGFPVGTVGTTNSLGAKVVGLVIVGNQFDINN